MPRNPFEDGPALAAALGSAQADLAHARAKAQRAHALPEAGLLRRQHAGSCGLLRE